MLNNNLLSKTIRAVVSICATAVFLSACSTSSTQDSASTGTSGSSTTSSSSSVSTTANPRVVPTVANIVYFEFDSSELTTESVAVLNVHVAELRARPRAIRLEGHADERGTREYNIALGERRAQAVRSYLQSKGVNSPIEVVSYGEEKPAVTASNDYAWQQNRRVVVQ